jgi:predicted porin
VSAFAQSSVTIDGNVNMGMARSAAHANSIGGLKGDRNALNFKINEDMGGGTTAGFTGQFRWMPVSGNSGYYASQNGSGVTTTATDGRGALLEQTKITLANTSFGKLDMGRFTNMVGIDGSMASLQEDSGYGANAGLAVYGRMSGQVQYTSPSFAGINFQALYVDSASNKYNGGNAPGVGYAAAGTELKKRNDMSAMGVNYSQGPVYASYQAGKGLLGDNFANINATYDFGVAKVAFRQWNQKDDVLDSGLLGGAQAVDIKAHKTNEFGIQVPYKAWVFASTRSKSNADLSTTQTGVSTTHNVQGYKAYYYLSKRTSIQFEAATKKNAYNPASTTTTDVALNGTSYFLGLNHGF